MRSEIALPPAKAGCNAVDNGRIFHQGFARVRTCVSCLGISGRLARELEGERRLICPRARAAMISGPLAEAVRIEAGQLRGDV